MWLKFFVRLSLCLTMVHVFCWAYSQNDALAKGSTYALVIGISDYKDENIKDLKYAHKDAEIFASYLASEAGGSVPKENIKLLLNENATISNIYVAKKEMENSLKKNDLFYFYFSGHGDVESDLYKLGFLLAYDTPHKSYLNNAIRIEDINIMANTLSVLKGVNVILISDACHAGKLTGSDNRRGITLADEQLEAVQKKEIRIASCEPDQKSQEDEVWGGGRGVFSYHLINGMKGMADAGDMDGVVTLQELKTFLEDKVANDVQKIKQKEQLPVVLGKSNNKVSFVDETEVEKIKAIQMNPSTASLTDGDKSVDYIPSDEDKYFNELFQYGMTNYIDFSTLKTYDSEQIIDSTFDLFLTIINTNNSLFNSKWSKSIKSDRKFRYSYRQRLASLLHNEVQEAINRYIASDNDELAKRNYSSNSYKAYERYADMLSTAMVLIDSTNHLHHIMKVKRHYFNGVAFRLRINSKSVKDSLLSLAITEQDKALALETKAAYILNELAVLYSNMNENDKAENYLLKAIELIPDWAVPIANLSSIYQVTKRYKKGIESAKKAVELKPNYTAALVNLGLCYYKMDNYLYAEEYLRKAIDNGNNYFLTYEYLGNCYFQKLNYQLADSFYMEAFRRESDQVMNIAKYEIDNSKDRQKRIAHPLQTQTTMNLQPCYFDTTKINGNDLISYFAFAYSNTKGYYNYDQAEKYFRKVIAINPNDPIVYYHLGKLQLIQKKYIEADFYFNQFEKNAMSKEVFENYYQNRLRLTFDLQCEADKIYKEAFIENGILYKLELADFYKIWGYHQKAIVVYKEIIKKSPSYLSAYEQLWKLYESLGQYQEAEDIIIALAKHDEENSYNSLIDFYDKLINKDFYTDHYRYKAGLLIYNKIENAVGEGVFISEFENECKSAINYFSQIDVGNDKLLIQDVHHKLGNLYKWMNHIENCRNEYIFVIETDSNNVAARQKLVKLYLDGKEYEKAMTHLTYMDAHNTINFSELMTYAHFNTLSGNLEKSDRIFERLNYINPNYDSILTEYTLLHYMYRGQFQKAREGFKNLINIKNAKLKNIFYTLSRINASLGNIEESLSYLNKAADAGFTYGFVVDFDTSLESLKKTNEWENIKGRFSKKLY